MNRLSDRAISKRSVTGLSPASPWQRRGWLQRMALASSRLLLLEEDILLGGQAVLEGVMMRGPRSMAVAVRRPSGEIEILRREIPVLGERYPILKLPVLRGAVVMIQALVLGISSLNFSAETAFEDLANEEEAKKAKAKDDAGLASAEPALGETSLSRTTEVAEPPASQASPKPAKAKDSSKAAGIAIAVSVIVSLAVGMALFFLLPLALTDLVKRFSPALENGIVYNLVDGGFRIVVFLLYLFAISMLRDIKRVFEYHGAAHKTVYAHEGKLELPVENVRRMSRLHPRCGTSFLLFVMVVSIIVFSVLPTHLPFYIMIFPRLAMVPLIAGLSYEAIRWSARHKNALAAALIRPGLWLQRLTTREPDDTQIAVAIRALDEALEMERRGGLPAVPA